jgi:hypothetical protein
MKAAIRAAGMPDPRVMGDRITLNARLRAAPVLS